MKNEFRTCSVFGIPLRKTSKKRTSTSTFIATAQKRKKRLRRLCFACIRTLDMATANFYPVHYSRGLFNQMRIHKKTIKKKETMSKKYKNIFTYLDVDEPEESIENKGNDFHFFENAECWYCGSMTLPLCGPAHELLKSNWHPRSLVCVCVDCGQVLWGRL